jgi:hypothetical protein
MNAWIRLSINVASGGPCVKAFEKRGDNFILCVQIKIVPRGTWVFLFVYNGLA